MASMIKFGGSGQKHVVGTGEKVQCLSAPAPLKDQGWFTSRDSLPRAVPVPGISVQHTHVLLTPTKVKTILKQKASRQAMRLGGRQERLKGAVHRGPKYNMYTISENATVESITVHD